MARKLKTYVTSVGFFDLAIAAPSMKAALEAWGANTNLFHQGFASEATDPAIIDATMARPGVVLRRPVGSNKPFEEHAALPENLAGKHERDRPAKRAQRKAKPDPAADEKTARQAALAYEREQSKRDAARRKEEAARAKLQARRQQAIAKAQAAFDKAEQEHTRKADAIEAERSAIDARAQAEDLRWQKLKSELEKALRRARE